MIAPMASKVDDASDEKVSVSAKVSKSVVDALDELANAIRPKPSRSAMVALALEEFVKGRPKPKGKS